MNLLQAVLLGALQGITEFFPISSSGHLVILQNILGISEPQIAFDIFLHAGTLLAVLVYFRKDVIALFGNQRRTLYCMIIASAPTFVIAILFKEPLEKLFGMPVIVGYMLMVTGLLLVLAQVYPKRARAKSDIGYYGSVLVGVAQGVAIIPGISRSGATITTGVFCGLDVVSACRFSFLLSIPAVAGACLFKAKDIAGALTGNQWQIFVAGGIAALATGLIAIKVLLSLVGKNKLYLFGIYCIIAGLSAIILAR